MDREYPHAVQHVLKGPEDLTPSALHPIFHGSFDWHSCVHAWWQVLRLARLFPELAPEVYAKADWALIPSKAAGELAYLQGQPSFERPYGWGWLLALHHEASRHEGSWADALQPIASLLASRFVSYLPRLTYPVRAGTHANTAFALVLALEWAELRDPELSGVIREWAVSRFGGDHAAPWLEPSGEDFLSPTLTEALLMSRVLSAGEFRAWFDRYLPSLPLSLLEPVSVSDRSDGRIGHLDGLNLSRAWCWKGIGADVDTDVLIQAALPHLTDGYMGEHWLATYALLALSE